MLCRKVFLLSASLVKDVLKLAAVTAREILSLVFRSFLSPI